jgi:hypothetical protein
MKLLTAQTTGMLSNEQLLRLGLPNTVQAIFNFIHKKGHIPASINMVLS